jgi:hypothetical protein
MPKKDGELLPSLNCRVPLFVWNNNTANSNNGRRTEEWSPDMEASCKYIE